jgi:hypothetical protein
MFNYFLRMQNFKNSLISAENIKQLQATNEISYNVQDICNIIETQQITINKLTLEVKNFNFTCFSLQLIMSVVVI